jgi:hypothetical protein
MAPKKRLGTGARRDVPDKRDIRMAFDAVIAPPIDWVAGSSLPRPTLVDQDTSDACVAHSLSYYHWQLRGQLFSRIDLFARIATDAYGASIRDGVRAIVGQGQALESELADPSPETPANMRVKTGIVSTDELQWKEFNYVQPDNDIDSVARAILTSAGCVMGVYGVWAEWNDLSLPEPPTAAELANIDAMITANTALSHALYFVDFHMHANADGSQEKCLIAATSWPVTGGITEHHIRERYFTANATFDPWTLIPTATVAAMVQGVKLTIPDKTVLAKPVGSAIKTGAEKVAAKKSPRRTPL